jgi:hypothetical protein
MKRLPVKSHTLSKKIRSTNPWGLGEELGKQIDCYWDSFKAEWPKENHTWLVNFSMKHRLNSSFVFKTICNHL